MYRVHSKQRIISDQPGMDPECKEEDDFEMAEGGEDEPVFEPLPEAVLEPAPQPPKEVDGDFDDDLSRYPEPEIVIDEVSFPEALEKKDAPSIGIMGFLCCGGDGGFKKLGSGGAQAPTDLSGP